MKLKTILLLVTISLSVGLLYFGCKTRSEHTIYTKIFSLKTGEATCHVDTINSYRGNIVCGTDSIYYDLGFNTSSLSDILPNIVYFPERVENLATGDTNVMHMIDDTTNLIVVRRRDYDIDAYRRQNLQFKKERGYTVKYTFPIDTTKGGLVGAYYDNVKVVDGRVLKFTVFLINAHSGNYSKARNLISQIYLYPFDSTHLLPPWGTLYVP